MTLAVPVPAALTRHLEAIESALESSLPDSPGILESARYAMGWGSAAEAGKGKRIRPSLVLLGAECVEEDARVAMPGAAAIELIHNFSLVHDDIQDQDTERHGQPTVWSRYGVAQAINTGDLLFSLGMSSLAIADLAVEKRVAGMNALLAATARMLHGQWADIELESAAVVTRAQYLAMVGNKTGALLGASLQLGALLGGASASVAESLRAWGESLGVAFQVWDDYLGIWGDPATTGKSNASDIARKKRSLPIVLALEAGGATAGAVTAEYQKEAPDAANVVRALAAAGIQEDVAREAEERARQAIAAVSGLPLSESARDELASVAMYLVQRNR